MRAPRFLLLLLLLLPLKSCEVPDVQPFAQATKDMAATLNSSFKQVADDLNRVSPEEMTPASQQLLKENQQKLKDAAAAFTQVAHGFDAYAEALDEVATTGANRNAAIAKVNKALQQLATSVPVYGKAVGLGTDILATITTDISSARTIKQLSDLASPAQDRYLQHTAEYLRQATKKFAAIEAEAQNLLRRHSQSTADKTWQDLYNSSLHRQQNASEMLYFIVEGEYLALSKGGDMSVFGGHMKDLIERERALDSQQLIATAWNAGGQRATPKLLDALRQREKIYQEMLTISSPVLAWQAARQTARSPVADMLDKAGVVLTTWADTHHKLRESLVDAKKITAKQATAYAKAVQDLREEIDSVKKAQK